ncbi:MAG: hypothetical protein ACOYK9_06685 [Chlamydiia bacterium]
MALGQFQNNLRFALRKEVLGVREGIPLNNIEKIGDKLSWFAYDFRGFCSKILFDPRFVTVVFTAFAMGIAAFLFYPSDTWSILSTICKWVFDSINWGYVRFGLWLLCEVTIFGVGMRAFGRFTNQQLLQHYQAQGTVA